MRDGAPSFRICLSVEFQLDRDCLENSALLHVALKQRILLQQFGHFPAINVHALFLMVKQILVFFGTFHDE